MDNDVHNSFPPPTAADRVDDVDTSDGGETSTVRVRSRRSRLAPPAADQRVDLPRSRRDYLPWVVMGVLLGMAVAVYFLF